MRHKLKVSRIFLIVVIIYEILFLSQANILILNAKGVLGKENALYASNNIVLSYSIGSDVDGVAISSEGNYFVVRGGCRVYFFNKTNPTPLWNYTTGGTGNQVSSVSISSDGQYITAGSDTQRIYLFDKINSTPLWYYIKSSYKPFSVAISSDGQYVAAGVGNGSGAEGSVRNGEVYIFNKTSPVPLWSHTTGDWILSIGISSNGQYIVAGGADKKVYLFNKTSHTPLWSYETGEAVNSVAISSDGQYIVAGSKDKNVYLFNNTHSTPLWNYTTDASLLSVKISSNGQYIVAGGFWDNMVYFFNNTSNTPLWTYSTGDWIKEVTISSNGQYIVAGGGDNNIYLFDNTSNTPLWTYSTESWIEEVAISSNGQYIAAVGDKNVYLIPRTYKPISSDNLGMIIVNVIVCIGFVSLSVILYFIIKKYLPKPNNAYRSS
jgi:WD40 repeat protein